MLHVRYGAFQFGSHEASLSMNVYATPSERGFEKTRKVQFDIIGEVCEPSGDPALVDARMQQIFAAFDSDFQDVGLHYNASGLPTSHFLANNDPRNLTGNQLRRIMLPQVVEGEFITGRKFHFVVEAELDTADSTIIDWHDAIIFHGNAGPNWEWRRNAQWGFYPEMVAPNSLQTVEHIGFAVGMRSRILPVTPYFSPPFEDNLRRKITFTTGKRHPQGYTELRTDWHYVYQLPVADDTLRPSLP